MRRAKEKNRRFHEFAAMIIFFFILVLLGACDNKDVLPNGMEATDNNSADLREYIEEAYGFADNPVYGTRIAHVQNGYGSTSITYDEKFKEYSQGGAVFYKAVAPDEKTEGWVCTYLADDENNGIALNATYSYSVEGQDADYYGVTLAMPAKINRCYAIIGDDVLASVQLTEQEDVSDKDELIYSESIAIYRLTDSGLKDLYTISRTIGSNEKELKNFVIRSDAEQIIYAAGYSSYTADGAEFVSTQQEFCDRANALLKNCSLDCITLNKTSWINRWYGMSIDENGIGNDMVKVDFVISEATIDENGDEENDIVITMNDEKQREENIPLEEIEDFPVTYNHTTETTPQEPIVMPENVPQSIDEDELQNLTYFNIDGFWHSTDNRYVYYIYTQHPDSGFGTLYFADLEGRAEAKHGQVKQTSSYSVILKAMEDDVFSPEVFAANNQLVSDEIVLEKVDDSIASNLFGTWTNEDVTYTFDMDGNYHVKTSEDSDWGKYFVVSESELVLGERLDNLTLWPYEIDGDTLTINNTFSLKRQ